MNVRGTPQFSSPGGTEGPRLAELTPHNEPWQVHLDFIDHAWFYS